MTPYIRSALYRISSIRPLRPPSTSQKLFYTKTVHTSSSSRPQLGFLPSASRIATLRSVTTKTRDGLKFQLRIFVSVFVALTGAVTLATLGKDYLREQWLERLYPSPAEWDFLMRLKWHSAQHELALEKTGTGTPDWFWVGAEFDFVVNAADDDPHVRLHTDWDPSIPGIDEEFLMQHPVSSVLQRRNISWVGKDVTAKSEDWKQGYFEAWMAYALSAEKSHGLVVDKTRRIAFPKAAMIGPSNPEPEQLPPGIDPPLEENCEPGCESPSFFYTHILTTKGFNARQRLDAALAWAAWLEYEGNSTTAGQLYDWTVNLACSALQAQGTDPGELIDPRTKIIKSTAPFITSNILKACTKAADFQARHYNLSSALGIYTSILRAYRAAPEAPADNQYTPVVDYSMETLNGAMRFFSSLWDGQPPRTLPPSGNTPFERTQRTKCDEALIMTYIGEILFATGSQDAGLAWTRDATALAEAGFQDERLDRPAHLVCSQCMGAVLENWHRMTNVLVAEEDKRRLVNQQTGEKIGIRRGWLESLRALLGGGNPLLRLVEKGDWRRESAIVEEKKQQWMERRLLSELEAMGKMRDFMKFTSNDFKPET